MPAWLVPLAISLGSTLVANKISSDAQKRALRKREATNARLLAERTKLAEERLAPMFKNLKVGGEDYFDAAAIEDAKNLKTFDDTEQNSEVKIGQGLNLGGNELAEFTALKSDANAETAKRNNARKFFHSQFTGINPTLQKIGNEASELTLNRNRFADELSGRQIGDDLEVSSIRPDAGMLALADAIRIGGQMYGMYNMASGLGTTAPTSPDLTGLEGITSAGYTAPASAGSVTNLGQAFGSAGGAGATGIAPVMGGGGSFGVNNVGPAWPLKGGGWFPYSG